MTPDHARTEIERLRAMYVECDASADYGRQFRPFDPREFGYRSQQLRCLAEMLREAGRHDLSGMRILDFGCGTGRLLGDLIGLGAEPALLCGVDLSKERLDAAARRHPHVRFQLASGSSIGFGDASFDLVIQAVVFSSIGLADLRRRLADEMLRVLAPGGFVYWWDLFRVLPQAGGQRLDPRELFLGCGFRGRRVSWLPRPSEGIARRRWKWALGAVVDLFAARPTHLAALIGPKT